MKHQQGFTIIELILVVIILAILSAFVITKLTNISDNAKLSTMKGMQAALMSATDLTHARVILNPSSTFINNNGVTKFTLDNGDLINIRGLYPDGRWGNTLSRLVEMDDVTDNDDIDCEVSTNWCARNRGTSWFNNRIDSINNGQGRGFIIFPNGYNHNESACYLYYYNPNTADVIGTGEKPFTEIISNEC